MTSNLGSQILLERMEKKGAELTKEVILELLQPVLKSHFRPEFLNRLDDILPFLPLKQSDMAKIVTIQLEGVKKRIQDRDIQLTWSENLVNYLAAEGYDPIFGARPLKRLVQEKVLNPLSRIILEGKLITGEKIELDWAEDKLSVKRLS